MTLGNRQGTVDYHKRHVCEVGAGISKVFRLQFHVVYTGIRAAHAVGPAEAEIGCGVQSIADAGHSVPRHCLGSAVIQLGTAVLSDRHNDFIVQGSYRQRAKFFGYCVVCSTCIVPLDSVGVG